MNSITDKETTVDLFNLSSYINGLAMFTCKCQTPMTMALQGSWGSGKSSMMNLLQKRIEETENNAAFVHFNTWQYSQFKFSDNLPLVFLRGLIEKVSDVKEGSHGRIDHSALVETAKNLIKLTMNIAFGSAAGELANGVIDSIDKNKKDYEHKPQSEVKIIEDLKNGFADLVKKRCKEDGKDRIVFFIDDLDRLQPQKAVELMEILKIIIECDACVFILAIDYEVVSRGVRAKYGQDIGESKVKNFFDKIIQVPFTLPVSKYDLSHYIEELIDDSGLSNELKYLKTPDGRIDSEYIDMIRLSIGGNPRSIKKLLNTFRLLSYIINGVENISYPILFSALCLQLSYERVYNNLLECSGSKESLTKFFKLFESAESLKAEDEVFQEKVGLKKYTDLEIENLCLFLSKFHDSIQNEKGEISDDMADIVRNTLFTSIITATTTETNVEESKFDTKIEDIYETVKYVKERFNSGKDIDSKLINDARKKVAQSVNKNVSCVTSECTRGLGINASTFEDYVRLFLCKKDDRLVNTVIETNKNKRILKENIQRKFNSLL